MSSAIPDKQKLFPLSIQEIGIVSPQLGENAATITTLIEPFIHRSGWGTVSTGGRIITFKGRELLAIVDNSNNKKGGSQWKRYDCP